MSRRIALILAVEIAILALIYLYFCRAAGGFGFPLDDSWIHSHFARNLAEGRGLVYNPGQHVTSTAVLYSILLAALFLIIRDPFVSAVTFGLILHFGASVLVYASARRLAIGPRLSIAAAVCFAAIPRLMWGALSGMEVPLYVFLVCLGIYWHVRYDWNAGAKAYLTSLAFALATLARPECAVFLGCSCAARLIDHIRSQKTAASAWRFVRTIPIHVLVFAAVIAPAVIYNLSSYHLPLPPAFYAKTRPADDRHVSRLTHGLQNTGVYLGETVTVLRRDNDPLCLMLVPGLVGCLFLRKSTRTERRVVLPIALALLRIATAFAAPLGPRRSYAQMFCQHGRYSAYLCPLMVLIAIVGVEQMRLLVDRARISKRSLGKAFAGALLAVAILTLGASNWRMAHTYALEVQNINDMQVALGKWAADLPKGSTIAVNDAGAIAYFSGHRILDTVGVVNPEVVPYLRRYKQRQIGLMQYLEERKPEYVIIFPNWYPQLAGRRDILHPIKSIRLRRNLVCGGREMIVYRTTWEGTEPTLGSR